MHKGQPAIIDVDVDVFSYNSVDFLTPDSA